jgi:4-amino-4-deoxy-L-arabinose transferase-like glycosyltransferase
VYVIIVEAVEMQGMKSWLYGLGWTDVRDRESRGLLWLWALTLFAFLLRVYRLDFQPLWWDEGWTVYFATSDPSSMLARTAIDIHPPFYYLVLHIWTLILGPGAVSVRLFSVVVGTLSVPLMFLVGRRLFGGETGIVAALVLAVAPFHIYYSQEARMYALVAFLALLSTHLFLSLLDRQASGAPTRVLWLVYVIVTSLAMYTEYYAAFVPLAQTLYLFIRFPRYKAFLARWIGAQFALFLAYAPWLLYAGPKLIFYVGTKLVKEGDVPVDLWTYLQNHLVAFSVGHLSEARWLLIWLTVVSAGLALLGVLACWSLRRRENHSLWPRGDALLFVLVYLFLPLCAGYAVNLRYPFTSPAIERLFLFSAPALYLLVAAGVSWLRGRFRVPWLVLLALVIVANSLPLVDFYTAERYAGEDYRPLVEKVQALALPEDVIVAVHPWQIGYFQAYFRGELPTMYLTPKESIDVTSELWAADRRLMVRDLESLLGDHRFLWFPAHQSLGRIVEGDVEDYLFHSHHPILSEWFSDSTRLSCHAAGPGATEKGQLTNFGDKVSLLAFDLAAGPYEAGWDAALLEVRWRVEGELQGRHQTALRLVDREGGVWAAEDREPQGGLHPFHEQPVSSEIDDHLALLIPAGTPPGSYRLQLGLYQLESGEWLDVLDEEGAPQGVETVLGELEVRTPSVPPPEQALFIQYPRQADFSSGVRFLGYSLGGERFQPGDTLELTLFWKALEDLQEDYDFSLGLEDGGGKIWASIEGPPGGAEYSTSMWSGQQLVRSLQRLMVPAGAPSGTYRLVLSLHESSSASPVALRRWLLNRGYNFELGVVEVEGRAHQTEPPPSVQYPVSVRLGDGIQLLGYSLDEQEVVAGGTVGLTLYWQALSETDTSYTVFNHLIDGENRIWGQKDAMPGAGTLPTSSWISGEYVVDEYQIQVQTDAPPGQYIIETGMYDLTTMTRLPIVNEKGTVVGDRILLEATPIHVR